MNTHDEANHALRAIKEAEVHVRRLGCDEILLQLMQCKYELCRRVGAGRTQSIEHQKTCIWFQWAASRKRTKVRRR